MVWYNLLHHLELVDSVRIEYYDEFSVTISSVENRKRLQNSV